MSFEWNLVQNLLSGRVLVTMYTVKDVVGDRKQGTSVCTVQTEYFRSAIKVSLRENVCLSSMLNTQHRATF